MALFNGAKDKFEAAKARAGAWAAQFKLNELPAWWRRRDKSAERAAVATRAAPFLGSLYQQLAFLAWFLEFGFATLWALRANGEIDWTYSTQLGGADWTFNFSAHILPATLTTLAVGLIVAISVTWIPVYNALRGMGRLRRGSVLVVGPLCTAIAILGAIVVQVENVSMDARDAAVVQQQAGQDRASIERQIAALNGELANATDQGRVGRYAAIAASVGVEAYRRDYLNAQVLAAEDPSRRLILQRALGSATAADALRARRTQLEADLRTAPTEASLRATTNEVQSQDVLSLVQWASDHRVVLIGMTLSLVGLLCLWQAQGLREASELLNPDAPEQERALDAEDALAAAVAREPPDEAGAAAETIPPLDLPPLPDLRGVEDAEFDALAATVDEEGRVLRRFSGWRAPKGKADKRRAPEPDGETMAMADTDVAPDAPAPAADSEPQSNEDTEDAADWVRRQAQQQTEPAK